MNPQESASVRSKDSSAIAWWIGWIVLTIVSFFISCYFWTGYLAEHAGPMSKSGMPMLWVALVFGSWMVLLVPLIVLMYNKVDRAYEDARIGRENASLAAARKLFKIKSVLQDPGKRVLSRDISLKLKKIPRAIHRGHLITVILNDGRRIPNVFVRDGREVLGIYDAEQALFSASDIIDIEPVDLDKIPVFQSEKWLRLDGVGGE